MIGDPLDIDTDIHGGITLDMKTTSNAGTHNDLAFTDTNLRQGRNLDLTNTFKRDSQSLGVDYTLSGDLNVFGFDLTYNKYPRETRSRTAACRWSPTAARTARTSRCSRSP